MFITKIYLLLISFLSIFLINKYRTKISKKMNLVDKPDQIRKLHTKPTPLLGGTMIFSVFFFLSFISFFIEDFALTNIIIFLVCFFCFLLGMADDSKDLNYKYKFLILFFIYYSMVSYDSNLQINQIYFETFDKTIYLNSLNIIFTVFCLLLLTNSLNLIDGIDGLCIMIFIIYFMWMMIIFDKLNHNYLIFIFSLIYILILNLKKNVFLGDSGTLFVGTLIGLLIISNYNTTINNTNFPVEDLYILLMLPGTDMLRVFIQRILKRKNPFRSDRNHLHHIFLNLNIRPINIVLIFFLLTCLPIIINFSNKVEPIFIIISFKVIYLALIFRINKLQ